jgi:alanine racemase
MTPAAALARPVWAEIDLGAVTHNVGLLRARAGRPVRMIVPVKANAYGHGVEAVGRHLERIGVDAVATANVEEALRLRQAGVRLPILLYASGLPAAAAYLSAHGLTPTIHDRAGLAAAAAAAGAGPAAVHVEVDAGFGRLGVRLDEAADLVRAVLAEPRVRLEGLYTHVPFADDAGEAWARRRLDAFAALVRAIESEHRVRIPYAQAAASAVLMRGLPDGLNTIAPGHLTYGLSPLPGTRAESLGFRPALRALRAQLIHVGRREPGDDLAGGRAERAGRTAVILLGIDNGYAHAGGSAVLVRGRRCPVLSVTAEYAVLDVTAVPAAAVGDVATVVGRDADDELALDDVVARLGAPGAGYWMMGLRRLPLRYVS